MNESASIPQHIWDSLSDEARVVIGVVSWSTGANNTAGCGGLTGVTPLTLYRAWIERTAQSWRGR